MGLPQEQCNLKTLPLNISYFIHLFQQGLEGWWNVASVQTAVIFSQKHCLYGIPASLQGGLKPYCTILQIISVCVLDPKREEMKHNNFVGCEGGGGGGGWSAALCLKLGWEAVTRVECQLWEIRFIPRCCALISELQNYISCLSFSSRWNKDDISWEALWGEKAPQPYKYRQL